MSHKSKLQLVLRNSQSIHRFIS